MYFNMKLKGIPNSGLRRIAQVSVDSLREEQVRTVDIETMSVEEFLENPLAGYQYDDDLPNEANANQPDAITLGPKFFELDSGGRSHVLSHENAHRLVDQLQQQEGFWDELWGLVDSGAFGSERYKDGDIAGINGQYTPIENLVEAFAVYISEPEWLQKNYPGAYAYVADTVGDNQ